MRRGLSSLDRVTLNSGLLCLFGSFQNYNQRDTRNASKRTIVNVTTVIGICYGDQGHKSREYTRGKRPSSRSCSQPHSRGLRPYYHIGSFSRVGIILARSSLLWRSLCYVLFAVVVFVVVVVAGGSDGSGCGGSGCGGVGHHNRRLNLLGSVHRLFV